MTEEEYFRKTYPDVCYGDKPLSPFWDLFQDRVEFGERQFEKKIEELEKENAELKADNDTRKYAMAMSEKVEKQLRKENAEWEKFVKDIQNRNEENYLKVCHKLATELNRGIELADQLTKAKEYLEQTLPYLEYIDEESDELYDKINEFIKEIEK